MIRKNTKMIREYALVIRKVITANDGVYSHCTAWAFYLNFYRWQQSHRAK
jgi:hypothetical protein